MWVALAVAGLPTTNIAESVRRRRERRRSKSKPCDLAARLRCLTGVLQTFRPCRISKLSGDPSPRSRPRPRSLLRTVSGGVRSLPLLPNSRARRQPTCGIEPVRLSSGARGSSRNSGRRRPFVSAEVRESSAAGRSTEAGAAPTGVSSKAVVSNNSVLSVFTSVLVRGGALRQRP